MSNTVTVVWNLLFSSRSADLLTRHNVTLLRIQRNAILFQVDFLILAVIEKSRDVSQFMTAKAQTLVRYVVLAMGYRQSHSYLVNVKTILHSISILRHKTLELHSIFHYTSSSLFITFFCFVSLKLLLCLFFFNSLKITDQPCNIHTL